MVISLKLNRANAGLKLGEKSGQYTGGKQDAKTTRQGVRIVVNAL